jgi:hypothetical protein
MTLREWISETDRTPIASAVAADAATTSDPAAARDLALLHDRIRRASVAHDDAPSRELPWPVAWLAITIGAVAVVLGALQFQ